VKRRKKKRGGVCMEVREVEERDKYIVKEKRE
jgi:hypothetical protein